MAFDYETLALVSSHGNANIGQSWEYKEDETIANLSGAGYFNSIAGQLRVNDTITLRGSNGVAIVRVTDLDDTGDVTVAAVASDTDA